jgi:site-specific DNA recombinase
MSQKEIKSKQNSEIYKALIYCRVSSDRQVKEGHGLESQELRCINYAKSKGYHVTEIFRDEGISGGLFERPEMRKLIEFLDKNISENFVIIFDDLKRFARDTIVHFQIKSELQSRGARIECLNFNFEDSPEGEFVETIFAAQAQLERQQNKRQVIQKQKARIQKGYWCLCAPTSFEFYKDPFHGKIIKPVSYSHIYKSAIEKYASNQLITLNEVKEFINNSYKVNDIRTKHGNLRVISVNGVRRILSNPLFAGYLEYKPWDIPFIKAQHEGIITLETYNIVQDKLLGRTKKHLRKDYSLDFPLRGYIICSNCKDTFTASWNKGRNKRYANYSCKRKECYYRYKSISKDKIEPEFESILIGLTPNPAVIEFAKAVFQQEWQEHLQTHSKLQSINSKDISGLQEQIETLIQRIGKANSDLVIQEYEKQIESLSIQKKSLEDDSSEDRYTDFDFGTALDEMVTYVENPLKWWKSDSYNNKQMLLQTMFEEKLTYDLEKGFGTINLSLPAKIFTAKSVDDIQLVEMAGFEPASG